MAQAPAKSANILVINDESQKRLVDYVRAAAIIRDEGWQNRSRFENIDRTYMREKDYTAEQRKADLANRRGDPTKLQNVQVPMVLESVENSVGFLSNVYLLDYPMFKFGAAPEAEQVALMWNTLVGEDQIHYGWPGQFNIAFRNGAKYNFSPIEIDWCTERMYKVANGDGKNGAVLEQVEWTGNKISSKDPYNTIYDPRVPIHEVHTRGEFSGYIELMTRIELKLFLASLGDDRLKNDKKAFESPEWDVSYYIPYINRDTIIRSKYQTGGEFNWVNWVTNDAQNHIQYKNMYTVVKLYARIMPFEFGIRAPKDQTPDIWKLIVVNGVLVYAQPMPNAHGYLPLIIVQPHVDNLSHQTKTLAENQAPFQDMVSSLLNAELSIARRMTVDRMLYNPLLVDPDHINSPNPGAKIPLRPTAYGRKLEEAVYKIPFEGAGGGMYVQAAQLIGQWGMRANGQNNVSVGQFQKGNKLENEFNTTMANAGTRERTQAIMWETFGMQPIKTIIKSNILQFAPSGEKYNTTEQATIAIDPVEMRKTAGQFAIGDGLLPIEKLMHADVAQAAFGALQANPQIGQGYKIAPLFSYLMELQGVDKLSQFEQDPAAMAYQAELSGWINGAVEICKATKDDKDVMKMITDILGPKPTPPQPPQPGAPNGTNPPG